MSQQDLADMEIDTPLPKSADGYGPASEMEDDGAIEIVDADQSSYRFSRKLEVLSNPTGVQSSAVGALRNHLAQQHLGLGRRSLAICSVSDDVSRPLVSASLAIAAAQAGASTVLVDANLREPQLDTYFTPLLNQPGLSEYLAGRVDDPSSVISAGVLPNLSLVHAGTPPENPQQLLAGRQFDDFVTGLMRSFDFTIVDCPSARHSSDARRIASALRYALIVVKRDVTFISDVKRLIDDLSSDRVVVVGTFMNVG